MSERVMQALLERKLGQRGQEEDRGKMFRPQAILRCKLISQLYQGGRGGQREALQTKKDRGGDKASAFCNTNSGAVYFMPSSERRVQVMPQVRSSQSSQVVDCSTPT